jgi:toxin ParE1/3/4
MTLLVRPEARHDISEAAGWYEKREDGLGEKFLLVIDQTFVRVAANPDLYPQNYQTLRRALVQRFPYSVFFREFGNDVIVYAVLHQRQDYKILDDRLKG